MGLTVLCVEVGDYLGRGKEYVAKLESMVRRNLQVPFEFACISDREHECRTIPATGLPGWWAKLQAFTVPGRILYLDLDVVISKDITGMVEECRGSLWALDDFVWSLQATRYDPARILWKDFDQKAMVKLGGIGTCNSSVMMWEDDLSYLYETYTPERAEGLIGDQNWINREAAKIIQLIPHQWYESYCLGLGHMQKCRSIDAPIKVFHGKPKPHDVVGDPMIEGHWR